jgi:4-diphosphocytidyl-2-C-methyl-D-erythritol kinase
MLLFPNAKINIGLNITRRLRSGYHTIESCFCPVGIHDIIEVKKSNSSNLIETGIPITCKEKDNLLLKVLNEIKIDKSYSIHLHKNIPIGSGLGGGSSDAAFLIKYLNTKKETKISKKNILEIAESIGSDCPFFIDNKIQYVTGTGNIFDEISIDIRNKYIVIYSPDEKISTSDAYQAIKPKKPNYNLKEVLENENIENWKNFIKNDFEEYALKKINSLKKIKDSLKNKGAKYISLSGSGSSVFGVFDDKKNTDYFIGHKNTYITKVIS